jgi:MFS family permease
VAHSRRATRDRLPLTAPSAIRLGLRANWQQFTLLVIINAFVGGMVGLERAVLPLLAEQEFVIASRTLILSFVISFGVVKALANLFAGRLSDRIGRKHILVAGWLIGVPVPLMIMLAPSWSWVVAANVLLGINQGLCWSTTIIMKIDLVGPSRRGLAMGLNECAGYVALALAALASGYLAATYALRPQPFYLGIVFALAGLLMSVFLVRDSRDHAREEARHLAPPDNQKPSFWRILLLVSWKDRALFATSQAGLVNNLNDGMVWGLFPLMFVASGLALEQVGVLAALYPGVWGIAQIGTGALSDRLGRKGMIVGGMWLQALAILLVVVTNGFASWASAMVLLGLGTALVYPTLLAAISDIGPSRLAGVRCRRLPSVSRRRLRNRGAHGRFARRYGRSAVCHSRGGGTDVRFGSCSARPDVRDTPGEEDRHRPRPSIAHGRSYGMTTSNTDVKALIRELQSEFDETMGIQYDLPQDYLQQPCGHQCARGGSARDLLVHNIFYEKQHTGQVWSIRDQLRLLQGWGNADLSQLLVEYYLARAQLITSLFGLTDDQLELSPPGGGWTVRQTIDHVLSADRSSISALGDEAVSSGQAIAAR